MRSAESGLRASAECEEGGTRLRIAGDAQVLEAGAGARGYHMPPVGEKGHVPVVQIPDIHYRHECVTSGYWEAIPRHEPDWIHYVERWADDSPECPRCSRKLTRHQLKWCSHRCAKYAWWWRDQLERYWESQRLRSMPAGGLTYCGLREGGTSSSHSPDDLTDCDSGDR